jgi:ATP synthase F1 gamma subunit
MPTITEVREELDDTVTLQFVSSAFTEAAAARVQKIKEEFERNRQFFDEITRLYHLVRVSGKKAPPVRKGILGRAHQAEGKEESGKTLSVAVTSNQRFYGNINTNIMETYMRETEAQQTDRFVIGTTGFDLLRSISYAHPFEKLIFAKDLPTEEETRGFLDHIKPYRSVILYFPKFVSLVSQTVGKLDICQAGKADDATPKGEVNILFEPEYSEILEFFQTQVRSLLFLRVLLETDLARTAARLITMSGAEERARDIIKQKKSQLRKMQSSIINIKLLETFNAMKGVRK